jgi:hypothetical protein
MLIYSQYCLRDVGFNFRIIALLVRNLKIELVQIREEEYLYWDTERFLWVVGLGGMAAKKKGERRWFVERFRRIARFLGSLCWREVRAVLEGVLWMWELD